MNLTCGHRFVPRSSTAGTRAASSRCRTIPAAKSGGNASSAAGLTAPDMADDAATASKAQPKGDRSGEDASSMAPPPVPGCRGVEWGERRCIMGKVRVEDGLAAKQEPGCGRHDAADGGRTCLTTGRRPRLGLWGTSPKKANASTRAHVTRQKPPTGQPASSRIASSSVASAPTLSSGLSTSRRHCGWFSP